MIRKYYKTPIELLASRWPRKSIEEQLLEQVKTIAQKVRSEGDVALLDYTQRFDGVKIKLDELEVSAFEIEEAYNLTDEKQVEALRESRRRLEIIESLRLKGLNFTEEIEGVKIRCSIRALHSVGCYIPGGKAVYPSSVVMSVVPAKVAGVKEVIICTPPGRDKRVNPLILVAADICGVNRIFRLGGAQAISAMAYGTKTIPRVDKIVGPGNRYVTAAKVLVSDSVAIDKPAGPSEVLVLADDKADPQLISLDMISQAEHGSGGSVGLVTTSLRVAEEVESLLDKLVDDTPKSELIREVISSGGFIYAAKSLNEAVEFVNEYAPEHLEIMASDKYRLADMISSAGLILLGPFTPVSSTDYCMGVNHVLPTGGYAKIYSGLTVLDYLKPSTIVESSRDGLENVRKHIKTLSEAEGLPNHGLAVEGRFKT